MSGPPPKPTALKALEGTLRPDRVNPREPRPAEVMPGAEPPHWLADPAAREYWTELVDLLTPARIVGVTDMTALAVLASAFGSWRHWQEWLRRHRPTYRVKSSHGGGYTFRARPETQYLKEAESRLVELLREFGMTPASRTRIAALPSQMTDPAEEFLSGRRGA